MLEKDTPPATNNNCLRCGICCLKGGPALHQADLILIDNNTIKRSQLVTILKGELAYKPNQNKVKKESNNHTDNQTTSDNFPDSVLSIVEQEFIKIKANPKINKNYPWACLFLSFTKLNQSSCQLHPNNPEECKLLFCQNTDNLINNYQTNRLMRSDMSNTDEQALQAAHAEGTNWANLGYQLSEWYHDNCINNKNATKKQALSLDHLPNTLATDILKAKKFDDAFRSLVIERKVLNSNELDFHLGRNITSILKQFEIYL